MRPRDRRRVQFQLPRIALITIYQFEWLAWFYFGGRLGPHLNASPQHSENILATLWAFVRVVVTFSSKTYDLYVDRALRVRKVHKKYTDSSSKRNL